jgi:hypothetical protein
MRRGLVFALGSSLALAVGCETVLGVRPLSGADAGVGDASIPPAPVDATSAVEGAAQCAIVWVDASGGVQPVGAVANGPLDASFVDYVCRVVVGDAQYPGKLLGGWYCYYGGDAGEVASAAYEVLVTSDCAVAWSPATPSGVNPPYALQCGQDTQGSPLFCCQDVEDGGSTGNLGQVGASTGHACVYSLAGQTLSAGVFNVLTVR